MSGNLCTAIAARIRNAHRAGRTVQILGATIAAID